MLNGTRIEGPAFVGPNDQITIGETVISVRAASSSRRVDTMTTELVTPSPKNQKTSIDLVADAMVGDKTTPPVIADVIGVESQPGTLTVLFSDIESSTELALAMGDALWFNLLRQHHNLVAAHVRAHHGRIVKNQGDGYMLCFRSARQALLTAIGLQRDLARLSHSASGSGEDKEQEHPEENPWAATASSGSPNTRAQETPLRVRVGIHTGEVMMQDDGDLFGKHVIVAARIGALASGGQILVSTLVKQITEPRADFVFGPPYEAELKGIDGLSIVHELDWKQFVVEEISP